VESATAVTEVVDDHRGPAVVAGYTVLHAEGAPRGVVVADLPDGRRTLAVSDDPRTVASMESDEWCGQRVAVAADTFTRA
jgi:hypothetical protein